MRTIISLIVILIMSPTGYSSINWAECLTTTACYVNPSCVNKNTADMFEITEDGQLTDEKCPKAVSIRPINDITWEIFMKDEMANNHNGIKILNSASEVVYTCQNNAVSTNNPKLKVTKGTISDPGVQCFFNTTVAGGKSTFKTVLPDMDMFAFSSDGTKGIQLTLLYKKITDKLKCTTPIIHDPMCDDDESCIPPRTEPRYECFNDYDLLYKYADSTWTVAESIECLFGFYAAYVGKTPKTLPKEEIQVKCVRKKCRLCRDPRVEALLVTPDVYDKCQRLQCNTTRMIINKQNKHDESSITCRDSKWKINNKNIDIKDIECVDEYDCRKFQKVESACSVDTESCKMIKLSTRLEGSCDNPYQMYYVDSTSSKDVLISNFSCNYDTGIWSIIDKDNNIISTPSSSSMKLKCSNEDPKDKMAATTEASTANGSLFIIIGCVGGGVLLIGVIILFVCWYCHRKKKMNVDMKSVEVGSKSTNKNKEPKSTIKTTSSMGHSSIESTGNKDTKEKRTEKSKIEDPSRSKDVQEDKDRNDKRSSKNQSSVQSTGAGSVSKRNGKSEKSRKEKVSSKEQSSVKSKSTRSLTNNNIQMEDDAEKDACSPKSDDDDRIEIEEAPVRQNPVAPPRKYIAIEPSTGG